MVLIYFQKLFLRQVALLSKDLYITPKQRAALKLMLLDGCKQRGRISSVVDAKARALNDVLKRGDAAALQALLQEAVDVSEMEPCVRSASGRRTHPARLGGGRS